MAAIDLPQKIRIRLRAWYPRPETVAYFLLTVVPILVIIGFPLVFFLWGSVWSTSPGYGGHFTLEAYRRILDSSIVYETVVNTFIITAGGTILSLALGIVFLTYSLKTDGYGRRLIPIILIGQYLQPSFVTAITWQYYLGPQLGALNQLLLMVPGVNSPPFNVFSLWGIIVVGATHYAGLVYLLTSGGMKAIPATLEEIGWINGASLSSLMRRVTLPLVLPGLAISAVLIMTRFMQSFGIPIILGTPEEIFVIATLMFQAVNGFSQDFAIASALGVFLLSITLLGLYVQRRLSGSQEKYETLTGSGDIESMRFNLGRWRVPVSAVVLSSVFLLYVVPYAVLFIASFQETFQGVTVDVAALTLENYLRLFVGDWSETFHTAIINTVQVAVLGALAGMILSTLSSYVITKTDSSLSGLLDYLTLSPAAIPGIIYAIALLWIFLTFSVGLMNTIWILVIAFSGKFLMYGTRAVNSSFRAIGQDLEDAARVSGSGMMGVFRRIFFPLISPGFAAGFIIYAIDITKVLTIPLLLANKQNEMIQAFLFRILRSGGIGLTAATVTIFAFSIFAIYGAISVFTDLDITSL